MNHKIGNVNLSNTNVHNNYARTDSYGLAVNTASNGQGARHQNNAEPKTRHANMARMRPDSQVSCADMKCDHSMT